MDSKERYFWDLTGYLVVRNVLSSDKLKAANDALDHYADHIQPASTTKATNPALQGTGRLGLKDLSVLEFEKPYCDPFRNMLAHPQIVSRLNVMCHRGFRLDHGPQFIGAVNGTQGGYQHGAGDPHREGRAYHHQNGQTYCGGVTVTWNLTDADVDVGGFGCVSSSHKSKYRLPRGVKNLEDHMGCVNQVALKAGDVLFFMDGAQSHGTLPWKADHPRRTILFKFASRTCARTGPALNVSPPEIYWDEDIIDGMTAEQRTVMYGPYSNYNKELPLLTVDGNGTVRVDR